MTLYSVPYLDLERDPDPDLEATELIGLRDRDEIDREIERERDLQRSNIEAIFQELFCGKSVF